MKKRQSVVEDVVVQEKVAAGLTPAGKPISVVRDTKYSHLWKVQFDNGGELPLMFRGLFLSDRDALTAVKQYLENKNG